MYSNQNPTFGDIMLPIMFFFLVMAYRISNYSGLSDEYRSNEITRTKRLFPAFVMYGSMADTNAIQKNEAGN